MLCWGVVTHTYEYHSKEEIKRTNSNISNWGNWNSLKNGNWNCDLPKLLSVSVSDNATAANIISVLGNIKLVASLIYTMVDYSSWGKWGWCYIKQMVTLMHLQSSTNITFLISFDTSWTCVAMTTFTPYISSCSSQFLVGY